MTLQSNVYEKKTPKESSLYGDEQDTGKIVLPKANVHQVYWRTLIKKTWRNEPDEELKQTFMDLMKRWKEETFILSSTTKINHNKNYQYIIGLGEKALPLILKDLEETHAQWFWALEAITRANPVPEDDWGNISKMTEIWLNWGRQNGYI